LLPQAGLGEQAGFEVLAMRFVTVGHKDSSRNPCHSDPETDPLRKRGDVIS
jgi:hypothetical protein